jgi:hypothetical protein
MSEKDRKHGAKEQVRDGCRDPDSVDTPPPNKMVVNDPIVRGGGDGTVHSGVRKP